MTDFLLNKKKLLEFYLVMIFQKELFSFNPFKF